MAKKPKKPYCIKFDEKLITNIDFFAKKDKRSRAGILEDAIKSWLISRTETNGVIVSIMDGIKYFP